MTLAAAVDGTPGADLVLEPREYPAHLSYSQVKSIITCGEQYRLERRFGLAGPPGWATVGGKGFHIATEYFDLAVGLRESPAKLDDIFSDIEIKTAERVDTTLSSQRVDELLSGRFAGREADLVKMLALTEAVGGLEREALALTVGLSFEVPERDSEPTAAVRELWLYALQLAVHEDAIRALNYHPEYWDPTFWTASGRESKAWPGKENRDWWNHFAPRWFVNYMHWRQTSGWQTAVLADGRPAKELDVSGELAGMTIKAYLDSVELDPAWTPGLPTVVDVKTSARPVVDPEQLGFYATMLEILGYPRPTAGRYYNARIGELSRPYGLGKYSLEYFVWKYGNAKDKRDKGLLEANTSSPFCKSCKVRAYCYAVPSQEGYLSHLIPRPWEGALERLSIQAA